MAHPIELRRQLYDAYSKTRTPVAQLARTFGVSRSSVYNWRARMRQTDSLQRSEGRGGRRPKIDEGARWHLRLLLQARSDSTLAELCVELERLTGVRVHRSTVSRTLRQMGLRVSGAKKLSRT